MTEKYLVLEDCDRAKEGDIVYRCRKHDYGLARDDTMATGVEHISVSYDPEGDYPFVTVPLFALSRLD